MPNVIMNMRGIMFFLEGPPMVQQVLGLVFPGLCRMRNLIRIQRLRRAP